MAALELMAEQIRSRTGRGQLKPNDYYSLLELYVEKFGMSMAGVADLDGNNLEIYTHLPSRRSFFLKKNMTDRGFLEPIRKNKTSYITPLIKGQVSPKSLIVLATPIWDYDKKNIRAIIGSSVLADELQRLAEGVLVPTPLFQFVILDQRNTVVAESGMKNFFAPLKSYDGPVYKAASNDEIEFRQGQDENGNELHGVVKNLKLQQGDTWKIFVTESQDLLHRQERIAWMQILLVTVIGLLVSFLIAKFLTDFISRPILDLISSMRKIEEGHNDLTDLIQKPFGFQETFEAWQALATMTKKLNDYTANLESEVSERTKELITTHKALDEQRVRAVESARLAALGEMAGGIAHEINNPLSIISLITQQQQELLSHERFDIEKVKTAFQRIDLTTRRISKIIYGLKEFSRDGGTDPLETTSLQSILDGTLTFCHEKFKHNNIQLIVQAPPSHIILYCRPVQISQVLLNLLNNAFDAIQNLPEKWIEIKIVEQGPYVEIRVIDSGEGISADYRDKIFQPFFTSKEVGKGTGLGLSISKGIVEAHHGQIFVDSESPHTTIVVRLPKKTYNLGE